MIRIIFILLFFLFFSIMQGQVIPGTYYGYLYAGTSYTPVKNGKTKPKNSYTEKTLVLNADSSFSFSFSFFNFESSQGMQQRTCKGRWKLKQDTLLLNSRYPMRDFYTVDEKQIPTCENRLIKLAVTDVEPATFGTWVSYADILVNGIKREKCDRNDTVYMKLDNIYSIHLSARIPQAMEWQYTPVNKQSNAFVFHLKTEYQEDNICLENYKLILKKGTLLTADHYGTLSVEGGTYGKKERKKQKEEDH